MTGQISRTIDLPASADEVWTVVGDFNGLPQWNEGLATSELSADGRRRTLTLKAGGKVVEDLVEHDASRRRYSYSIVEGPIPVARHKATLEVLDRRPNQCAVRWSCEFEPKAIDAPAVAAIFARIYEGGLNQLAGLFGGQARAERYSP